MVPLIKSSKTLVWRHERYDLKLDLYMYKSQMKFPDYVKILKGDIKSKGFYCVIGCCFSLWYCKG